MTKSFVFFCSFGVVSLMALAPATSQTRGADAGTATPRAPTPSPATTGSSAPAGAPGTNAPVVNSRTSAPTSAADAGGATSANAPRATTGGGGGGTESPDSDAGRTRTPSTTNATARGASDAGTVTVTPDAGAPATHLIVVIIGLRNDRGLVRCALHNNAQAFPRDSRRAVAHVVGRPRGGVARCDYTNIRAGTYAVAVHHDEDEDDHFDTGFLGIPLEGYGFSRNARPFLGPPSFDAARFNFAGGTGNITLSAQY